MADHATILLVDDQPNVHEVVQGLLAGQDYHLASVGNGIDALKLAISLQPDLVLLDVMMPDLDGFEVCRQLRDHPRLAEVPILMLTALDDREARLQGIAAGADDFISKPFDTLELLTRIKTILKLNRYRRLVVERSKFKWVVEQAEDGYLLLDEYDRISYANPQACLYLGLANLDQAPTAPSFLDLVAQKYQREPENVWQAWLDPQATPIPMYLIRPESAKAENLWLQVDRLSTTMSGASALVRLRDVTDEVRTDRLVWTFHSQVSHKIRTPVAAVLGFLTLLVEEVESSRSETENMLLGAAYKNALRLRDEVNDIFAYLARPQKGENEIERCTPATIPRLVIDVAAALDLKTIKILLVEMDELPENELALSRRTVETILWEVLENAQKFHPAQTPSLTVTMSIRPTYIQLQIGDDGLNLASEHLTKIWTPYFQAERHFTGQVAGVGLGLSMVAAMLWEVNGTYRAYNRPEGPGLIIEFTVPFKDTQPPNEF